MSEPFLGEIKMVGWNFAARGWAFCDGQLLAISSNSALFSLLGTIYGGDGRTSFGLPDMRGRVPTHHGNGPGLSTWTIGERGGAETVTQTVNQMANHRHNVAVTSSLKADEIDGSLSDPEGNFLGVAQSPMYAPNLASAVDMGASVANTVTEQAVGGQQSMNIVQPTLCVSFEIALVGLFPSRN